MYERVRRTIRLLMVISGLTYKNALISLIAFTTIRV